MRILTIILLTSAIASVAGAQTDWPIYGHDPGGLQYSPLKEIDTKNVSKLQVAWTYDTRPPAPPLTPPPHECWMRTVRFAQRSLRSSLVVGASAARGGGS